MKQVSDGKMIAEDGPIFKTLGEVVIPPAMMGPIMRINK